MAKAASSVRTKKYNDRKEAILWAASKIMNEKGLKGMTLAEVGEQFGLVSTGVAYYFSSKEELAAACYLRSIETFEAMIRDAANEETLKARLDHLVHSYFAYRKRLARGEEPERAVFDDIRALADTSVIEAYVAMFRTARHFIDPSPSSINRVALNTRAHLLLQLLPWVGIWLGKYSLDDYKFVAERFLNIISYGLGAPGHVWKPERLPPSQNGPEEPGITRETFLRAATQLINDQGYHGASVERISASLNVTKGSFYHHVEAKDDLVEICFERTIQVVRNAQSLARQLPVDASNRLASALLSLADHQLEGDSPLLRAATVSLPADIRRNVLLEYERNAIRFGSMVNEGLIDGSLRMVDVQIAAQIISAAVNALGELSYWLPEPNRAGAAESFTRLIFLGFTSRLDSAGPKVDSRLAVQEQSSETDL